MPVDPWGGYKQGVNALAKAAAFKERQSSNAFNRDETKRVHDFNMEIGRNADRRADNAESRADQKARIELQEQMIKDGFMLGTRVLKAPPNLQPQMYSRFLQVSGKMFGPESVKGLPQQWGPEAQEALTHEVNVLTHLFGKNQEEKKLYATEEGYQTADNAIGKKPYEKPEKAEEPKYVPGDTRDVPRGDKVETEEYQQDGTWKVIGSGEKFSPSQKKSGGDSDQDEKVKRAQDIVKSVMSKTTKDTSFNMLLEKVLTGDVNATQQAANSLDKVPEELRGTYETAIKILEEYYGVKKPDEGSKVITATNPTTRERLYSDDGGRTWKPLKSDYQKGL